MAGAMADLRYAVFRAGLETLYFSGAHYALKPLCGGVGVILTLHHVRAPRPGAFQPNRMLEVTPRFLENVVRRLKKRRVDLVSLDEVHRRLTEQDFSRRFVAFTFDDGYRDNLEHAWPILQRHEVPLTLFVATSFPDRLGELWWVVLEQVIAKNSRLVVEIKGEPRFFDCADAPAKRETFAQVYWWLRSLADERDLRQAVRDLAARYGVDAAAPCRELCMDWPEMARLAADPLVTIGAHTVNHVMLRRCAVEAARAEMKLSADVIEAALGKRPRHFAFPVGDSASAGPREFELAAQLGFATAVTTRPGVLFPEHREHLTSLPRVSLNGNFQALRFVDVLLSGAPFALTNGFRRLNAA
jgi:peptidoglycan/xylan/chitin deacetylase (PgdA/CDA1 family)